MDDQTPQVRTVVADIAQLIKSGRLTPAEANKIDPALLAMAQKYADAIGTTEFDLSVIAPQFIKERQATRAAEMSEESVKGNVENFETNDDINAKIEKSSDRAALENSAEVEIVDENSSTPKLDGIEEVKSVNGGETSIDDKPVKTVDLDDGEICDPATMDKICLNRQNLQTDKVDTLVGVPRIKVNSAVKQDIQNNPSPFVFNTIPSFTSAQTETKDETETVELATPTIEPEAVQPISSESEIESLTNEELSIQEKVHEIEQNISALELRRDEYINKKQDILFKLDDVINKEKNVEAEEKEIEKKEIEHPEQERTLEPTRWSLEDARTLLEKERWEINESLIALEKEERERVGEDNSAHQKRAALQEQDAKILKRINSLKALEKIAELRTSIKTLTDSEKHIEVEKNNTALEVEVAQKAYAQKVAEEKNIKKQISDLEKKEQLTHTENERHTLEVERNKLETQLRVLLGEEWQKEDSLSQIKESFNEKLATLKKIENDISDAQKTLLNLEQSEL